METNVNMENFADNGYNFDTFITPLGRTVNLIFIKHGSIAIDIDGYLIYIDPVSMFGNDFSILPKAQMVLITHEHHDHLDPSTIDLIKSDSTQIFSSARVADIYNLAKPLAMGETHKVESAEFTVTTLPAYNTSPEHLNYHPKSRGDFGYMFYIDGLKIYVAGDTENIPEMAALGGKDVGIAFLPVNQPFTMTAEQAIHAVEMIQPQIVYPYHFGQTDLTPIVERFADSDIDIRIRALQ